MKQLTVVLPTYNEALNIIPLIQELQIQTRNMNMDSEIIVVDDNSPDGTWKLVAEFAKQNPDVKLIHRTEERGLTSAINAGIRAAKGKLVSWMDCDFQHPPILLKELVHASESGEFVAIASRYTKGGGDVREGQYSFQRKLSILISNLSFIVTGIKVRDITSGYIVISKKYLEEISYLSGDYGEYFIDMLGKLNKRKIRFVEIPYQCENRKYGESKTGNSTMDYFRRGTKYLGMLFKYRRSFFN